MLGLCGSPYVVLSDISPIPLIDARTEIALGVTKAKHSLGYYGPHRYYGPEHEGKGFPADTYAVDRIETADTVSSKIMRTMNPAEKIMFGSLAFGLTHMGPIIPLRWPTQGYANRCTDAEDTPESALFPRVMEWVQNLPVQALGRVVLYYSPAGYGTVYHHADYISKSQPHEMESIWVRLIHPKPFYLFDARTREKVYVEKTTSPIMFNPSDYHGVDQYILPCVSMRVDVVLQDDFREQIGLVKPYPANPLDFDQHTC